MHRPTMIGSAATRPHPLPSVSMMRVRGDWQRLKGRLLHVAPAGHTLASHVVLVDLL